MRLPKTVKGYLNLLKHIELISPSILKGYTTLNKKEQKAIQDMSVGLSNDINEILMKED